MKTLKNKYKKAKAALKEQFSKSVAPGQHLQLADLLSSSSNDDDDDDGSTDNVFMSNELKSMVSMYDASDKIGKAAILSVASKDHNKQESMNIFNCSKWKIEPVRKFQKSSEGITMQMHAPQKYTCQKIDLNKNTHLLDFFKMLHIAQPS